MPCAPPTKTGHVRPPAAQRVEAQADRQVRCSRQQRSAGHLSPHRPCPVQARACCHGGVHTGRHKLPSMGSSEHRYVGHPGYVGRPDRSHRGTARWPPAPVERPGDPVTVRPDRRKHTRSLAHRRPGYGTRTSRPRRPSSEVGHRQADAGHSSLRPPARDGLPQPQRADPNASRAARTRECFGERSRWSARTTPAQMSDRRVRVQEAGYRSTLSNNRRPSGAVGPDAGTVAPPDRYTVAGETPVRPAVPDRELRRLRPVPQPTTSATDRAGGQA